MSGGIRVNPAREIGRTFEGVARRARDNIRSAVDTTGLMLNGRRLTLGELSEVQWMFGVHPGFANARIFPYNYWAPFSFDRAMAPNGNIYFPGADYEDDFSLPTVSLTRRAVFMHEATHLYQWYVLGQWVHVRGIFDRQYNYTLEPGKALKDYRLEQMGEIVQNYYILRHGGSVRGYSYKVQDYRDALPVGK